MSRLSRVDVPASESSRGDTARRGCEPKPTVSAPQRTRYLGARGKGGTIDKKMRLATWPCGHHDDSTRLSCKNQDGQLATLATSLATMTPQILATDLHGWERIRSPEKQMKALITP